MATKIKKITKSNVKKIYKYKETEITEKHIPTKLTPPHKAKKGYYWRAYYNKKEGKLVYNQYRRGGEGGTVIYKNGKVNWELVKNKIKDYSPEDQSEYYAQIDRYMRRGDYKNHRLTFKSLRVRAMGNVIEKILANFNYTADDVAIILSEMYDVEVTGEYILNTANWEKKENGLPTRVLMLPNGIRHEFTFDYKAGILI